jgi:hypothetical protein
VTTRTAPKYSGPRQACPACGPRQSRGFNVHRLGSVFTSGSPANVRTASSFRHKPESHLGFIPTQGGHRARGSASILMRFRASALPLCGCVFAERAQHGAHLHVSPFAAAGCLYIPLIQLPGNRIVACDARALDLLDDRQHIRCELPRIGL